MTQYKPMLAEDAEVPFSHPEWIYEVKWDGIRAISYVKDKLNIKSRNQKELLTRFPELQELGELVKDAVLDGEIIVMRDGTVDFQAALERSHTLNPQDITRKAASLPATLIVFDILEKDGKPTTGLTLMERKELLKKVLREGKHVLQSDWVETHGEAYYEAAIQRGLEGVITKKKTSKYIQGRSGSWKKIKKVNTCDCAIFGYTKGKGSREKTFGALLLGLYSGDKPTYVGKVGTGFTQSQMEAMKEDFIQVSDEANLEQVEIPEQITWLKPEHVCTVGYQNVTREGRLRMPRFITLRYDKKPTDCKLSQIINPKLTEYWRKRDFSSTPEPTGGASRLQADRFVLQEHHASRLHWDLRLERDGVLVSWAVPKGIPEESGVRRLAVGTEDHPLEYGDFEGVIPEGQYGAGRISIWDRGVYKALKWEKDKIEFLVQGEKIRGLYVLVRLKKSERNEWLLIKAREQ
jgi:DNA ligase D-like protein (predicted ligase)/DNA ligase D-like protein (predicted 3'-phosphoesterase)